MHRYRLTPDAEDDLLGIAVYTIENWGLKQLDIYEAGLVRCFVAIASGEARTQAPIPQRPELLSTRCQHHVIFWLRQKGSPPLIVAILHETMDLINRLKERL